MIKDSNGRLLSFVATVLTVYGIETSRGGNCHEKDYWLQQYLPFTVLKPSNSWFFGRAAIVATVLTVYGIETITSDAVAIRAYSMLQQYLPFTVLKQV